MAVLAGDRGVSLKPGLSSNPVHGAPPPDSAYLPARGFSNVLVCMCT